MVQSIGRGLDADFNVFDVLDPHIKKMVKEKYAPSAIIRRLPSAAAQLAMFGAELPRRLDRVVKSVERGEFQVRADVSGLEEYIHKLEHVVNRAVIGIIVAAIILALAITGYLGYILGIFLPRLQP